MLIRALGRSGVAPDTLGCTFVEESAIPGGEYLYRVTAEGMIGRCQRSRSDHKTNSHTPTPMVGTATAA
jgi:hypothetical protein